MTQNMTLSMFGVPKVIFGETGINSPVLDEKGKFAMTHGAVAMHIWRCLYDALD